MADKHSTGKTEKAQRTVIELGDIEMDVFLLISAKEYRLSQTQIAEIVGKKEFNVRQFIKSDAPEALPYKDWLSEKIPVEKDHDGRGGTIINACPPDLAIAFWTFSARIGNQIARKLLEIIGKKSTPPFESFSGTYVIYSKPEDKLILKPKKGLIRNSEAWYVTQLQKELGGSREVVTPAGNIDLLTSEQIIEAKTINSWKCAVGQIEVYGDYYPSHQKRIHLFGQCHEKFLSMVQYHCEKRQILVTWEA